MSKSNLKWLILLIIATPGVIWIYLRILETPKTVETAAPPSEASPLEAPDQTFQPVDFSWGSILLPSPFVIGMDGEVEPLHTTVQKLGTDRFVMIIQKGESAELNYRLKISYEKSEKVEGLEKALGTTSEATTWGKLLIDDAKAYLFPRVVVGAVVIENIPESVQFDWEQVGWAQ